MTDPEEIQALERTQDQLDGGLAFVLRSLRPSLEIRAEFTRHSEFLIHVSSILIGDGPKAAELIRRYEELFPKDGRDDRGEVMPDSLPQSFAEDAYLRVTALDKLVDKFPEHIRWGAESMRAWPMLCYRHTTDRRRFDEVAERLNLGAAYPLDTSAMVRFRPDTPMVGYLDELVYRVFTVWEIIRERDYANEAERDAELRSCWGFRSMMEAWGPELLTILRTVPALPPLNKSTALAWSKVALVPLILATDARDWRECKEPALQQLARQNGVKSRAIFKSRLLAAVSSALKSLARAG